MRGVRPTAASLVALAALAAAVVHVPSSARAGSPLVTGVTLGNGGVPYSGDQANVTTITPNGDGLRDGANLRFRLTDNARVSIEISQTKPDRRVILTQVLQGRRGDNVFTWRPADERPRTYRVQLTVRGPRGRLETFGAGRERDPRHARDLVVRVLAVDVRARRASYAPGERAVFTVAADSPSLEIQVFRAGLGLLRRAGADAAPGPPATPPAPIAWANRRDTPGRVTIRIGNWPSGVYLLRVTASDGRVGYAPILVRPAELGANRVAVVMPTLSWQAYNQYDADADGWGDTWYASFYSRRARIDRPYPAPGLPPFFHHYDLPFLLWLVRRDISVDVLAQEDVEGLSGHWLAQVYDLLVFPGHHEYATRREFLAVQRFRDLGGNIASLSANAFFWMVEREGAAIRRTRLFRDVGLPEAALLGVGYRASDDGRTFGSYVVRATPAAEWLFAGTGLQPGARFGRFGIEIDSTFPETPPGTEVVAEMPNLYGSGRTAQMTYYETAAGAKVFSAGAFTLAGSALAQPGARILENLYARLKEP